MGKSSISFLNIISKLSAFILVGQFETNQKYGKREGDDMIQIMQGAGIDL